MCVHKRAFAVWKQYVLAGLRSFAAQTQSCLALASSNHHRHTCQPYTLFGWLTVAHSCVDIRSVSCRVLILYNAQASSGRTVSFLQRYGLPALTAHPVGPAPSCAFSTNMSWM
jgi:hypothetical protein